VLHDRCSCDHSQSRNRGERVDDFFCQAVGKIFVLLVRTKNRQGKGGDPSRLNSFSLGEFGPFSWRQNFVNLGRRLDVFQLVLSKSCWISRALLTASRALGNSTRKASPIVLTSRPPCLAKTGRNNSLCSSRRVSASASFFSEMVA